MEKIIKANYKELARLTARMVQLKITQKKNLVLGLATGSTPLGLYRELVDLFEAKKIDFSEVISFNLDEYLGLGKEDKQSYFYYMWNNFFKYINIKPKNIFIPNGKIKDIKKYCRWYEKKIESFGGIDLQILGIGRNGHIGFNEPGSNLNSKTRMVTLSQTTIKDNARFFSNNIKEVPSKAITMGLGTIMKSKEILLLANGKHKAEVIKNLFMSKRATKIFPASVLKNHPRVTVILDAESAALL